MLTFDFQKEGSICSFFPLEEMNFHGREGISAAELEGDLEPALDSSWIGHLALDGFLLLN